MTMISSDLFVGVTVSIIAACLAAVRGTGSEISLATDFEGGMLGNVEKVSETEFLCHLAGQADHDGRNRQVSWYYFRVDGARGRALTFTLADLRGEYDYKRGGICITEQSPPVASSDGKTWRHLTTMKFDKTTDRATFAITPETDRVWIAHVEPYTASQLDRFLAEIRGHPALKDELIGKSVEGRDLHLLTIGDRPQNDAAKPVVWLMCRQHAWESGTSFVGEGAIRFLLSDEGKPWRERVVFKILPMMDPDGCVRGGVRFNRNGYDINRSWDTADPTSAESRGAMPEVCAAKKAILDFGRVDLFLTLHNQERDEWVSGSEKHKDLADRFFARLTEHTTFNPSAKGPLPSRVKPPPGRATVYQYLDLELGKPAFILEQGIESSSKLGRLPTSQDRLDFGRQLARAMCDAVQAK